MERGARAGKDAWAQVVGVLLLIISIGLVLAVGTALFSGVLSVHL